MSVIIAGATEGFRVAQDERALVERFARGEAAAFDEIVAKHQERIAKLVNRLLGWRGDVEDVVQEVFLAALKQRGSFRGQSSVGTWLAGIAIRRCRSWRHRAWVRWKWLGRQRERVSAAADEGAVRDEVAERVRQAVGELAAGDREVIVLYYLEEMSVKEMAEIMGVASNAIDVRLHRARGRLREKLEGIQA